jgi:hypothetical protein
MGQGCSRLLSLSNASDDSGANNFGWKPRTLRERGREQPPRYRFVGLNMQRGNPAAFDLEFVKVLAVSSRLGLPVGDGSLVEAEGGDDSLHGSAPSWPVRWACGSGNRGCSGWRRRSYRRWCSDSAARSGSGTGCCQGRVFPCASNRSWGRIERTGPSGVPPESGGVPLRIRDGPVPLKPLLQLHGCLGCYLSIEEGLFNCS